LGEDIWPALIDHKWLSIRPSLKVTPRRGELFLLEDRLRRTFTPLDIISD
jgi:hypothetical protein